MTEPELIADGREAQVYAVGDGLVLRRFRDPDRSARVEAELLSRLGDAGYPVPRVESWEGADLVMERVRGPRLSEAIVAGDVTVEAGAEIVAGLLDRLHALPWPGCASLVHLDLHPENVLLGPTGPVVVDWTNARPGEPGLDVAMSALIVAQVAVVDASYAEALTAYVRTLLATATADALPELDAACELRGQDPHLSAAELARLDDATDLVRRTSG